MPLPVAPQGGLVAAVEWRAAEASLALDLAELAFDAGRLAARAAARSTGAVQRLALDEAAAFSWWTGDRVSADSLALWLSCRIGAAGEGGDGLIRTAWAARRLMAPAGATGLAGRLAETLGGEGRSDPALIGDVATEIAGLAAVSDQTRGCALLHLWRALEERPDHLRGLEAAVLAARVAAG
ncbi:MAG: hypothetical protein ACK40I_03055 [Tabrizicola sp.]